MTPSSTVADEQVPPKPQSAAGLSSAEAEARLDQYGPNEPAPAKRSSTVRRIALLFLNPLVIILLVASLASLVLGDASDAVIILVIVLLGIGINFIQTYRSQQAINRLRANVTLTATVLRDGTWQEIPSPRSCSGRCCSGLRRGPDPRRRGVARSPRSLRSASGPYRRIYAGGEIAQPAEGSQSKVPDAPNLVFMGTSVVSGTATVVILATGPRTAFGAIAERLAMRPEETEFERSMRRFGMLIMRAVFFLVLFIVVVRVAMHKDAFESFVFAVALAVGLTPEFLPMITSVTLARGAVRMAASMSSSSIFRPFRISARSIFSAAIRPAR